MAGLDAGSFKPVAQGADATETSTATFVDAVEAYYTPTIRPGASFGNKTVQETPEVNPTASSFELPAYHAFIDPALFRPDNDFPAFLSERYYGSDSADDAKKKSLLKYIIKPQKSVWFNKHLEHAKGTNAKTQTRDIPVDSVTEGVHIVYEAIVGSMVRWALPVHLLFSYALQEQHRDRAEFGYNWISSPVKPWNHNLNRSKHLPRDCKSSILSFVSKFPINVSVQAAAIIRRFN